MSEKTFSEEDEKTIFKPGRIRPSQLITTFGPGSIVNLENDSVIVKGINFWANRDQYIIKNHAFLQKITKKSHFKIPYVANSRKIAIACKSFPRWGYCKKSTCGRLQRHKEVSEKVGKFFCHEHPNSELLPARLIMVCPQGHIDEFPWIEWAHGNKKEPKSICEDPKITWKGGTQSTSLSNFVVECETCGAKNSMAGATNHDGIMIYHEGSKTPSIVKCSGQMPWLDSEEECMNVSNTGTEIPIGFLSRSTSLYYSKVVRGLIIPKLAHEIARFFESDDFKKQSKYPSFKKLSDLEKAEDILATKDEWVLKGYTPEQIVEFMNAITERENEEETIKTELDIKEIEYQDLLLNQKFISEELETELQMDDIPLTDEDKKYFQQAREMTVLTLVEVERYFSRLMPPGEGNYESGRDNDKRICKIEVSGKMLNGEKEPKQNWLPANVKKGEGLFLVFKDDIFKKFNNDLINSRLKALVKNYEDYNLESGWPVEKFMDEKYIILHTISHILIKKLAPDSGFELASISERIYSSENMNGILIYTTSAGDGSFGGLIKQVKEKSILQILEEAVNNLKECPRDPICINDNPSEMDSRPHHLRLNGSACFACTMLPETSCENYNRFMDRKIWTDEKGIINLMKNG